MRPHVQPNLFALQEYLQFEWETEDDRFVAQAQHQEQGTHLQPEPVALDEQGEQEYAPVARDEEGPSFAWSFPNSHASLSFYNHEHNTRKPRTCVRSCARDIDEAVGKSMCESPRAGQSKKKCELLAVWVVQLPTYTNFRPQRARAQCS